MKLTKLQLENFRNYRRHVYEFAKDKDLTIIVGPNGMGKTNFLEAIYVLSLGRSFRTLVRDDLVEWKMDFMRCQAAVAGDDETDGQTGGQTDLEVFYTNYPKPRKNFKKNGVNLPNSEYLGNLLTVLFHPEDLNMLYLSPSLRRRYMDIVLCQTDRDYLEALSKYKKVLKQRNALLHALKDARFHGRQLDKLREDLDAWDKEIIEFGEIVIAKRLDLVKFLDQKLPKIYDSIAGKKDSVQIEYQSRVLKNYADELFNRRSRDIARTETTAGPHRDDLAFSLNEKAITRTASRGEFRTLLLALKLAEIEFIQKRTGKKPVLLLDDVFSELDRKRRTHLLKAIRGCQTIITTTDLESLGELAKASQSIELVDLK